MLRISQTEEDRLSLCSLWIFFSLIAFISSLFITLKRSIIKASLLSLWFKREVHIHFKAHPQPWSLSLVTEYRVVKVGRNLWRSSSPNSLLTLASDWTDCLGHLDQSLSISKGEDSSSSLGNLFYSLPCSQQK